eukprot:scaffold977_cov128-Cylindrotheca_fusiformis.AAC.6
MGNDDLLLAPSTVTDPCQRMLIAGTSAFSIPRWNLSLMYFLVAVSWFSALRFSGSSSSLSSELDSKLHSLNLQKEQTQHLIDDARTTRDSILRQSRKQQRTKRLFDHEARMSEELYEMQQASSNSHVSKLIEQRQNGITTSWVKQRQEALQQKITNLQSIVQEQSRKQLVEKFGHGPHSVRFDVLTGQDARIPGSFVVELASIDLMPYSVEVFLDMIVAGVWDNTVFYHHASQHHVVAAAPVSYGTFDAKKSHFEALGFSGLSFPEYSESLPHSMASHNSPHEQYTIGFSGNGPNFYINTIDNSRHHGPGGQGHHELSSDADPCFGKVVSGHQVIKEMMQDRSPSSNPKTWADFDISRLVRVHLLK